MGHSLQSSISLLGLLTASRRVLVLQLPCCFLVSMCVLLCREEIVQVLPSNSVEDMDSNVERIVSWARQVCSQ